MRCSIEGWTPTVWPLLAVLGAGCAFSPGDPWGLLDASLEVSLSLPTERLDEAGRLLTAQDYRIQLGSFLLRGHAVEVRLSSGGSGGGAFDPAHPPAGYSLCHSGHCHAADGRLVPYEEIAAEMGSTGSETSIVIPWKAEEIALELNRTVAVALGPCPDSCALEEGRVTRMVVWLEGVVLEGRAFDSRTGDLRRLPAEGTPFRLEADGEVQVKAILDEEVGPGNPLRVSLGGRLSLPESLLDAVDFSALLTPGGEAAQSSLLLRAIEEKTALTVDAQRR